MIVLSKAWQARLLGWGPGAATAVLVVLVGVRLADWTWGLIAPEAPSSPAPISSEDATLADQAPGRERGGTLQRLVALKPFGDLGAQAAKPVAPRQEVKVSRLNYQLRAIFITDGIGEGMCILSVPGNEGKTLFRVGDEISPGVVIHQIEPGQVILSRSGALEALRFPIEGSKTTDAGLVATETPTPGSSRAQVQSRSGAPAPALAQSPSMQSASASPVSPARRPVIAAGMVAQGLVRRVQSNPMDLASLIQGELVEEEGRLKGIRIRPGRDAAAFANAGLRTGDLVVAVNGIPVEQTNEAVNILHDLDRLSNLRVTVERKGQLQDLAITIAGP